MNITEFLLARIAEDEAVARSLTSTAWVEGIERSGSPGRWRGIAAHIVSDATAVDSAGIIPDDAEVLRGSRQAVTHAARHDPARVLAECEAKRRILELHQAWPVLVETPPKFDPAVMDLTTVSFRVPQRLAWLTQQEYRERFGDEPPTGPMLAALAAVYADPPDYNPAWRP